MKTKILIVDDLKENILALSELIRAEDVEIRSALTPDQALSEILDNEFALALVDVMMPTMSGFELARLVRGIKKSQSLPIIFVTARPQDSSTLFEGYESGAVDVLFKPLDPHIVRSKVRTFVEIDQQSRMLQDQYTEMSRLKTEAEAASEAKSQFLANMSHEIRTPLTAVLGFADLISQAPCDQNRADYVTSIIRNGRLLLRLIDDILDFSRIEACRLEFENMPFEVSEILSDTLATLTSKAEAAKVKLKTVSSGDFRGTFISDPLRIKQVLLNVVGNAIKFSPGGEVTLHTVLEPGSGKTTHIKFLIEDTGIGMLPQEAARIFSPFTQADSSMRRKYGGTGLGLTISKNIAQALGGDVRIVRTAPGQGSVFEVSFAVQPAPASVAATFFATAATAPTSAPAAMPSNATSSNSSSSAVPIREARNAADRPSASTSGTNPSAAPPSASADKVLASKHILVVDDVEDNRTLFTRYLGPSGALIELASNGREAIEKATQSDWDVVLMDIQMPVMDGLEATAELRRRGFTKPIIALTAHARQENLDRFLAAGFSDTLVKPVTRSDLVNKITSFVEEGLYGQEVTLGS
jgi:signal transduction histidine kinase